MIDTNTTNNSNYKKTTDDNGKWYTKQRILNQYGLVTFYLSTDVVESLSSCWKHNDIWMESKDQCDQYAVQCDDNDGNEKTTVMFSST